jgi:hypothetical protein
MARGMNGAVYSEIQRALYDARAMTDASEAHGTLAGALCAAPVYRFEDWLREILPEGQARPGASAPLQQLYTTTSQSLSGDEMLFEPLLPGDEDPLDARAAALAQWCQGFLYGLGSAHIHDASRLPGDVGEIVRDLTEITHAGVGSDTQESDESAYAELVEFVRVGVQLIFEELEPFRAHPERSDPEPLH